LGNRPHRLLPFLLFYCLCLGAPDGERPSGTNRCLCTTVRAACNAPCVIAVLVDPTSLQFLGFRAHARNTWQILPRSCWAHRFRHARRSAVRCPSMHSRRARVGGPNRHRQCFTAAAKQSLERWHAFRSLLFPNIKPSRVKRSVGAFIRSHKGLLQGHLVLWGRPFLRSVGEGITIRV
jgi:hypothetical protein